VLAVSTVLYGFGDKRQQLPETLALMNDIIIEFMEGLTREAMSFTFHGKLDVRSMELALRRDPRKVERIRQLVKMHRKVQEDRNSIKKDDAKNLIRLKPMKRKVQSTPEPPPKKKKVKKDTGKIKKPGQELATSVGAKVDAEMKEANLEELKAGLKK